MTPQKFRQFALSLPGASEGEHMDHPDFRVGGKIFATVCPDQGWGMVKLPAEHQAELLASEPDAFEPCSGAWGRAGATMVTLENAEEGTVLQALMAAWRKHAPPELIKDVVD